MALNFPSAPSANATYTFNGKTWTYNGNAWALASTTLSTDVVVEGTNLYFTNARVYSNVVQLGYITSNALSGYATNTQLNSYATTANLTLKANVSDLRTANVAELTNLYFTNARVYSNVTQLGYITSSALSGYATNTQLATYATNAQLASYATNAQLASYATNAQLASYATNAQLTSYATSANLVLKANIADLNTSNITEGINLYFNNARAVSAIVNTTLSNITVSGNITTGNVVVTGASRLGTVTSGTWNGASISTTYTDAKVVSVSNTNPITTSTSSGAVTIGMANSGVSATTYGSGSLIPVFSVDRNYVDKFLVIEDK
jgi:hypothetical protein